VFPNTSLRQYFLTCIPQHSSYPLSPPLAPSLLFRLQPNLGLLILLELPDFPAILLVLAHPPVHQILNILDKAIHAPIIHPQSNDCNATPEHQPEDQVDPEQHGAVHHVEDLEADKQGSNHDEDGRDIGLCDKAGEKRGEVCLQGARDAERGCDEAKEGRCDRGREQPREESQVICGLLVMGGGGLGRRGFGLRALYEVHGEAWCSGG
jgi:hypothetical protein